MARGSGEVLEYDAIVVGAGFAGMYMLHRLRGAGLRARVFEAGSEVGGTWYWNRYPGARCDVESMQYSYGFDEALQQEWTWNERYAPQPEILAYARHVADRFDLRRDIQFDTRVTGAVFDEGAGTWTVETDRGDRVTARFCILATGCLSIPNKPRMEGLEAFEGEVFHTGEWPHEEPDFAGKRVGVVGTGSSGIQSIPLLAERAAELVVFQRTPNYSIPAHNAPMDREYEARVKSGYASFREHCRQMPAGLDSKPNMVSALAVTEEDRRAQYEARWQQGGLGFLASFSDLGFVKASNDTAAEFVRAKLAEVVEDPDVAAKLTPDGLIGCKRLCVDTGYWATFNRPNVTLVDVKAEPIERITPHGLRAGGREHALDAIVFATGFDAMTGAALRIDPVGRGGLRLSEKWAEGPKTFLGLGVSGFPNLFTVTGPGSPSVLASMFVAIEQHVDWIHDCIAWMGEHGVETIEAEPDAEAKWVDHVNAIAASTLFTTCNSWYLGANIPGKPRVFMPHIGFPTYVERCEAVVAAGYEGFALDPPPAP